MNAPQQDLQTLAYGQDGRPVVISFEAAKALREKGRSFVHKPANLKTFQHPHHQADDDFGPEAA